MTKNDALLPGKCPPKEDFSLIWQRHFFVVLTCVGFRATMTLFMGLTKAEKDLFQASTKSRMLWKMLCRKSPPVVAECALPLYAGFDSLPSRAGLGHLGKGWIVRGNTTRK